MCSPLSLSGVFYFRYLMSFKNAAMEIMFWYNVIIRLLRISAHIMLKMRATVCVYGFSGRVKVGSPRSPVCGL